MSVTLADRDSAGATYATALSTWRSAYVDLAAKERILGDLARGAVLGPAPSTIDQFTLQHPQYAPLDRARLEDLIQARVAQLLSQ